jgi:hypothetical protein
MITVEWTDEFPTVEGAFYWVRHKLNHGDLDVASLLNGSLYFTYGGPTSKSRRKDYEYLGPITPDSDSDNERDALLSEVAQLRAEALKGICVYCGYIEHYESLEQKAGEEGNAMRVVHIRQCEARPEAKLIAFSEQLIDDADRLRKALQEIVDPISFIKARLQSDEHLDGQMAATLAKDASYLQQIARAALLGKER